MNTLKILGDNDPMPFGQYKGRAMVNVPAGYLLYLYDNKYIKDASVNVYVASNYQLLLKEKAKESGKK